MKNKQKKLLAVMLAAALIAGMLASAPIALSASELQVQAAALSYTSGGAALSYASGGAALSYTSGGAALSYTSGGAALSYASGGTTTMVFTIGQNTYTVNGIMSTMDVSPTIVENRAMLPVRFVSEPLGADVEWDGATQNVTVRLDGTKLELWIGRGDALVNGMKAAIDPDNANVMPLLLGGRTMLPLRFVTESLGCDVKWDGSSQRITITKAAVGRLGTPPPDTIIVTTATIAQPQRTPAATATATAAATIAQPQRTPPQRTPPQRTPPQRTPPQRTPPQRTPRKPASGIKATPTPLITPAATPSPAPASTPLIMPAATPSPAPAATPSPMRTATPSPGGGRGSMAAAIPGNITLEESKAISALDVARAYGLNKAEKKLYDRLSQGIIDFETAIDIDFRVYGIDPAKAEDVLQKIESIIVCTLPDYYLHKSIYICQYEDGTHFICPVYSVKGVEICAKVANGKIAYPPDREIAAAKAYMEAQKTAIFGALASLPVNSRMTQFEMEAAVHDWLCLKVRYNDTDPIVDYASGRKSMYGAVVEGRADCAGYAKSFKYILGLLGIESALVLGATKDGGNHMWNVVNLDGQWYHVDVTHDDTVSNISNLTCFHYYLNRTDAFIKKDHIIEASDANPSVACTAAEYNYYIKTGAYVASDEDFARLVPGIVTKARAEGAPAIEFSFAPEYATSHDISEKKKLVDSSCWSGITFYWFEGRTVVIGMF